MGNSIGGIKRRTAKVMKIDGTSFRVKPPVRAGEVVREHPGYDVLESEEVKQLGVRARPLDPGAPLKPGKLYFLVRLPRLPPGDPARRAWSGNLRLGARERLEGLMLARRSSSDLSPLAPPPQSVEPADDGSGSVRLRMRLPKADVARLLEQSRDAAEAAEKIMELCVARNHGAAVPTPMRTPDRATPLRTPDRATPLWTPDRATPIWTPDRTTPIWTPDRATPSRTPERGTPTGRKEKRTRFADLPDEKMGDYSTELLAYAMQV